MRNIDLRGDYESMYLEEGTVQDGPEPTDKQKVAAQKNIKDKIRQLQNDEDDGKDVKAAMALQKARAKAFGMKEETEEVSEGKKDACYHKVKSRFKVWPSAYASGALVKCRKAGADNWGNSTKKEELEMAFAFLMNEGYATTEDDALALLDAMSDDWYETIMEELHQS